MELRESSPTAMTVSSIINDKVTTRAKPLLARAGAETVLELDFVGFMEWNGAGYRDQPKKRMSVECADTPEIRLSGKRRQTLSDVFTMYQAELRD